MAASGFYFIEADASKNLQILRGTDFRNNQSKGLCLVLACIFPTLADYVQGKGRVRRSTDEGVVYELQTKMYGEDN